MTKRKASQVDEPEPAPRRSTRHKPRPVSAASTQNLHVSKQKKSDATGGTQQKEAVKEAASAAKSKTEPGFRSKSKSVRANEDDTNAVPAGAVTRPDASATERQYWLMKAEPETRLENGTDVRFSIDDLAAKTEPEPWDGIRNYVARNNLRAMKKGDLAFFYHSNCKEPGIVGTMEVVEEHSPDLSAHDPKAPYYDAKSKPSDPKWSVVHVEFRTKFSVPIGLKELKELGGPGTALENMQMLKQSRLSVSKVSAAEWDYLMGVEAEKAKTGK